jgi:hypothetical protein
MLSLFGPMPVVVWRNPSGPRSRSAARHSSSPAKPVVVVEKNSLGSGS